jgi:hypothetical protein
MEMVGGGKMHQYPATDECPHTPGPQESWQESFVLLWWDAKNAIGGYCRMGHEPNHNGGEANIWLAVHVPGESYFRNATLPLAPGDRTANSQGADNGAMVYRYDGQCTWTVKEPDLELTLRLDDFHPAIDGYLKDGETKLGAISSNHVEVASRIVGKLVAKGKTYEIDGLSMRDHGWGPRDWSAVWAHRWNVGVFDRDNSFCAVTMHLSSDVIARFGWVVRGDKVIYADKIDITAYMANDGASNVGGKTLMTLSTGERFEVHSEPVAPAALYYHHSISCVDTLSRLRWGDRVGYGVFETSTNPQAGARRPEVLDGGLGVNGWHRTAF